jgi:hypothetical protein
VTITVVGPAGTALTFTLDGNRISDPIDPIIEDVTLAPEYRDPNNPNQFRYPPDLISIDPFYWVAGLI